MTTKKQSETVTTTTPVRKGLFSSVKAADAATAGPELKNFKPGEGENVLRFISEPVHVRRHWTRLQTSLHKDAKKVVLCAKQIDDLEAYAAAAEAGSEALKAFMDTLPACPCCEKEEKFPGFYELEEYYAFNVVSDGDVYVFDITQKSIRDQLGDFEVNPRWQKYMPNGRLSDMEVIIDKKKTGPLPQNVKYTVSGEPSSEPLSDAQMTTYLEKAMDLKVLKRPRDITTEEGQVWWGEVLAACPDPLPDEKPLKK